MLAGVGSIFNKNGLPPRREEWQWAMRSVPSLWLRAPLPAAHRHHRVRKFQQRIVVNTQREVLPATMRDGRDARSTPQTTPYFKGDALSLGNSKHLLFCYYQTVEKLKINLTACYIYIPTAIYCLYTYYIPYERFFYIIYSSHFFTLEHKSKIMGN